MEQKQTMYELNNELESLYEMAARSAGIWPDVETVMVYRPGTNVRLLDPAGPGMIEEVVVRIGHSLALEYVQYQVSYWRKGKSRPNPCPTRLLHADEFTVADDRPEVPLQIRFG